MKKLGIAICTAVIFWFVMFSPWTAPHLNFWYTMMLAAGTLTGMSLLFAKDWKSIISFNTKDIILGLGSAALLWGVFYFGDLISGLLFDFARPQVDSVYAMRDGQSQVFLALSLLLWIGPAEEIFWRGYVQRTFEGTKLGRWGAFVVTTIIYGFAHIWAFNFMLLMAAIICGAFWGLIYMYNRNLVTVLISHAIWDVAVFILFPIM